MAGQMLPSTRVPGYTPWPCTASIPGGMCMHSHPPQALISFARVSGHAGDGSWAAPRGVPSGFGVGPGRCWTAAADTIAYFQRASRKQHWGYFAWASQVLMRSLLPYASFPYKRESYFSSSRQDSWESHTEKYRLHAKTPMQRLTEVCHTLI